LMGGGGMLMDGCPVKSAVSGAVNENERR
jgi:hypothetical protein